MITVFTPYFSEPSGQAVRPAPGLAQKIKSIVILAPNGSEIQLRLISKKTRGAGPRCNIHAISARISLLMQF
jgi:hypothetical protein